MSEQQYLDILKDVMENGHDRTTRPDGGTAKARAVFVRHMRFDLRDGFPLITTKKMAIKYLIGEIMGHIHGADSAKQYREFGSRVWDANANKNANWLANPNRKGEDDLGRIYGVQWRRWCGPDGTEVDQLANAIELIKNDPSSRYQIVSAWNPGERALMALPPCPAWFHFFVEDDFLSMHLVQRSCDMFLGVPFNIAQYALLLHMVAQVTGKIAKEFIHTLEDAHIYHNHFDVVKEQLKRSLMSFPKLWLNPDVENIDDFTLEDIKIIDYKHHPKLHGEMAV